MITIKVKLSCVSLYLLNQNYVAQCIQLNCVSLCSCLNDTMAVVMAQHDNWTSNSKSCHFETEFVHQTLETFPENIGCLRQCN